MTSIAAPEPSIHVTVIGLTPDLVRVVDVRRTRSDRDLVRIELGDCDVFGDLRTLAAIVESISFGLFNVERGRNGDVR